MYYRWFKIAIHSALVLECRSDAILLWRLYFENGGKTKWMGTLVQLGGFFILLPYYFILVPKNLTANNSSKLAICFNANIYLCLHWPTSSIRLLLYLVGLCDEWLFSLIYLFFLPFSYTHLTLPTKRIV